MTARRQLRDGTSPGRDDEFEAFYRAEATRLVRFLLRLGATPADAADAAGHALTEVYVRWEQIRSPRDYVRQVASHELHRLTARPRTDVDRALRGCWAMDKVEDVYQRSEVQTVLAALSKLPDRQREVMAWTYDGYRGAEIAEILGIPLSTVRSNLRHARDSLRGLGLGDGR
jgi:RNA polymerase sigma-70 factor (ECF subfamily)